MLLQEIIPIIASFVIETVQKSRKNTLRHRIIDMKLIVWENVNIIYFHKNEIRRHELSLCSLTSTPLQYDILVSCSMSARMLIYRY